jgi:hypothetical protein
LKTTTTATATAAAAAAAAKSLTHEVHQRYYHTLKRKDMVIIFYFLLSESILHFQYALSCRR